MKKLVLSVVCILFMATSCIEGDTYDYGSTRDRDNYQPSTIMSTQIITVQPSQWEAVGTPGTEGALVESVWEIPGITRNVLNDGQVFVSYVYYNRNGELVEHPLPYILPYTGTDGGANVLENYRYVVELGHLIFTIEDSDFQCYIPDEVKKFKVTILQNY